MNASSQPMSHASRDASRPDEPWPPLPGAPHESVPCPQCRTAIVRGARRCPHCHATLFSPWHAKVGNSLRVAATNPIFLLGLTTLVSLFIVPEATQMLARNQAREQARLTKALAAVEAAADVERGLNTVQLLLYSFHRDFSRPMTGESWLTEQRELRRAVVEAYGAFDSRAWWWTHQLASESELLGALSADETQRFRRLIESYNENLRNTTAVIDRLWALFIRSTQQPRTRDAQRLVSETRQELRRLGQERRDLAGKISSFFMTRRDERGILASALRAAGVEAE